MAFDFWEAQRKARSRTTLYISLFLLMTLIVAIGAEYMLRDMARDSYDPPLPYFGGLFAILTVGVASFNYSMYSQFGGGYVAKSMGGMQVTPQHPDFKVRQLSNIVAEIAIASGMPMPEVYVIPAQQINAFAAGIKKDKAAIAVTQGCLQKLNRDELQGVVAHEFGHIYNGDMRISIQLAAMVMGFFFVLYIGLRLMQFIGLTGSGSRRQSYYDSEGYGGGGGGDGDRRGGVNPLLVAALIFIIAGVITWFFGSLLKAAVSRQREYLADACAVQFTRNPQGIANALRRIGQEHVQDMPSSGMAFSHMYLDDRPGCATLFATHPPLSKRIAAIEGLSYLPPEWKKDVEEVTSDNPSPNIRP